MRHAPLLMVPGINGSGPEHWQSIWQARRPDARRFQPANWDVPERTNWLPALQTAIATCPQPPVLVAHSLGSLLVAFWAAATVPLPGICGAFLVAPPDPERQAFPIEAGSLKDVPRLALPFPALVVASADDRYGAAEAARKLAASWEAGFVCVGSYGHLNVESRVGDWEQGQFLLDAFAAGLRVEI